MFAESSEDAKRPIILSVYGKPQAGAPGDVWHFDLDALKAIGTTTVQTTTIWTNGTHEFEGVSLAALLENVSADGSRLIARALNDYSVELPVSDAVEGGALVAFSLDGELMSVRDKGPLWIIYPYDDNPAYAHEVYYSRSIWQLREIQILE
ncbi:molybdopterin-dependent oxidoreductase [Sinisalibacter lacisalsi]|uniref:molybdopterin-dependent oxidoreductase n=1 Tax=Sinisalibacter lacisalsi TaxID=1526570 RepID=UPI001E32F54C|nr:molybdopterin-dependent oxidoreductase [Sinisalibacter lacisalsi]